MGLRDKCLGMAVVCVLCASALGEDGGDEASVITLVGRKDKVTVIEKDGTEHKLRRSEWTFWNRGGAAMGEAWQPTAIDEEAGTAPEEPGDSGGDQPAGEAGAEPELTPEEQAAAEIERNTVHSAERLRQFQKQGAWLRDKSGNAISAEELDRRIERGDLDGIHTADSILGSATAGAGEKAAPAAEQDTGVLRRLRRLGAWFYGKDDKPISADELDKRIESGEVADIKAIDIFQREWTTEASKEEE